MRQIATGAVLAAVFVAAAGTARGQEAIPAFPDIAAPGGVATIAGTPPVPNAEPTAPPSEQGARVQAKPVAAGSPPRGSRLLRALVESTVQAGRETERAVPVFAAEDCPRALLRRLLAGAAGEADALAALAIETEILTLCSERQRIVTALFETEARLRELRAPAEPVAAVEAASITPPAPVEPVMERETGERPGTGERPVTPATAMPAPAPVPSPLRQALAAAPESGPKPGPSLGWFSIVGSAGALRAGITDGTGAWFVREGDALPGGGTVAVIAARPPSVRTTAPGEEKGEPLPFRPRPGGIR